MRIHHISCGYFRTPSALLTYGSGGLLARGPYVTHCLLIELPESYGGGLALVDTGLGRADLHAPLARMGPGVAWGGGLSGGHSALEHVQRLGFQAADVRHILMTHLDKDHTGGLVDFPLATVHIDRLELQALAQPPGLAGSMRYARAHFRHQPRFASLPTGGQDWLGFPGAQTPPGLPPQLLMVPLHGHTLGHCGIAIYTEEGWLLHCGDAIYHEAWLGHGRQPPWVIRQVEILLAQDLAQMLSNRARLQALHEHGEARIICSHDPQAFTALGGVG